MHVRGPDCQASRWRLHSVTTTIAATVLHRCEEIANLSATMLEAARDGHWHEFDRLNERASIAIAEVRALSISVALSAEQRRIKLHSMQRILENDGRIRELSQPWLRRITRWLPNSHAPAVRADGIFR
jgi:flagellar protein FliT